MIAITAAAAAAPAPAAPLLLLLPPAAAAPADPAAETGCTLRFLHFYVYYTRVGIIESNDTDLLADTYQCSHTSSVPGKA